MLFICYLFSLFVYMADALCRRLSSTQYARILAHLFFQGVHLEVDSAKSLAVSLNAAHIPDEPYFNTLLRIMATRCMMQAVYFCSGMIAEEDFQHYGLATPIYTHFTSPIRRFVCFNTRGYSRMKGRGSLSKNLHLSPEGAHQSGCGTRCISLLKYTN